MQLIYCSPCQVPKETIVFILPRAVVSMKMDARFSKSMVLKVIMMNIADCGVRPFTDVTCLVDKLINLLRYCFAHDAKDSAFPWCFKVDWSWLHWVTGNVNLLSTVE